MKTLCFVSFIVILTAIMAGCTKNNNYYYYAYCSEFDEKKEQCVEWMTCVKLDTKNGDCEEWKKTDKDPFVESDDSSLSDNDIENKDDEIDAEETDDFIFEDFDDVPDESPELDDEEKDGTVPDNDTDIPEDVCINLKNTGFLRKCFEAQDGEKIFISEKTEPGRCRATVESTVFPNRFFYGIELPFYTEDNSSSLDYNGVTQKVIIDTKEFGETSC